MDFFTVMTANFRILYCLFLIRHDRREILHFNSTQHPTSEWIVQQLREAFPDRTDNQYLIFDRDAKFGAAVLDFLESCGISPVRTSYRSPWQNGVAERWVRSFRNELLDHVIVLDESHLGSRLPGLLQSPASAPGAWLSNARRPVPAQTQKEEVMIVMGLRPGSAP